MVLYLKKATIMNLNFFSLVSKIIDDFLFIMNISTFQSLLYKSCLHIYSILITAY